MCVTAFVPKIFHSITDRECKLMDPVEKMNWYEAKSFCKWKNSGLITYDQYQEDFQQNVTLPYVWMDAILDNEKNIFVDSKGENFGYK